MFEGSRNSVISILGWGRLAFAASFFVCLLAGCSGGGPPMPTLPPAPPPGGVPHIDAAALKQPHWDVAVVAGDLIQQAHDNAASELARRFEAAGTAIERIHALSADPARSDDEPGGRRQHSDDDASDDGRSSDAESDGHDDRRRTLGDIMLAHEASVLRTLLALDGRNAGACLAYLGSTPDGDGLTLKDGSLSAEDLDRALSRGCGNAPTVVIVSSCNAGAFVAAPMTRPNRLILASSSKGRTGFGCGPNRGYTTFDECFLGALDGAATWALAFDRTKKCVTRREQLVSQPSVTPQSFIGSEVASLPTPWAGADGPDGVTQSIQFRRGIGRITADAVPYYSTLKALTAPDVDAYLHAPLPKALALTLAGTVAWAASAHGETPDDVARLALQRCEYRSGGSCMLYARDGGVTAATTAGQPPIHAPTLAWAGTVDSVDVPFIRDAQRPEIAAYLRLPEPKALALGPDSEAIGVGTGRDVAQASAAALASCTKTGAACVIFANNTRIVLSAP
jgi:hypothetical protein